MYDDNGLVIGVTNKVTFRDKLEKKFFQSLFFNFQFSSIQKQLSYNSYKISIEDKTPIFQPFCREKEVSFSLTLTQFTVFKTSYLISITLV